MVLKAIRGLKKQRATYKTFFSFFYTFLDSVSGDGFQQRKPHEEEDIDLILQHHRHSLKLFFSLVMSSLGGPGMVNG